MFNRVKQAIDDDLLRLRLKFLEERYWELYHKHKRLLSHLGLEERQQPETYIAVIEEPQA